MTTRRTIVLRRTAVRPGDTRIVGEYERVPALASNAEWCRFFAPASKTSLVCVGLLDNSGRVDFAALVNLARAQPNGEFAVDTVDLLAAIGLRSEAEVAIFADRAGQQIAAPVRALVSDGSLLLNTTARALDDSPSTSITLCLPGWTDPEAPFHPISMRAVSFSEFVQCE